MTYRPRSLLALAILVLSALPGAARAQTATSPSSTVSIEQVWSRATPKSASTAAIYMTLVNKGPADDRLIAASTPVASIAGLHEMTVDANNVMKMRPIEGGIPVGTGGSATLKPGGLHIMLEGLKAPLEAGQSFPVTLTFEKAGTVQVTATVQGPGAAAPPAMGGMTHDMTHDMNSMGAAPKTP